jgi:uncharacterized lipoprotein YajG
MRSRFFFINRKFDNNKFSNTKQREKAMKKLNLIMAAAACGMVLALTGCGRSDSTLTADACPLVVEIVTANGQNNVSCNSLQNIQKIDNDHYSAIAEVTCDGKTEMLNITITYADGTPIVMVL